MSKINLAEEEITKVIECLENQSEIPEELLLKLSPGFFEKLRMAGNFDFKTLDRMKIPSLEYAGKRSEAVILAQASLTGGAAPLQIVRSFANGKNGDWKNLIVQGDNLQFLKTCFMNQDPLIKDKIKGKVKLFYNDPPFGTGDEYGGKDGEMSYSARLMGAEYIESLKERFIYCRELLADDGSIFIRIDYHFGHYVKLILDEVFGKEKFLNELIINRRKKSAQETNKFNISTDVIFFYTKSIDIVINKPLRKRICSFCGQEKDPEWHVMISSGLRNPPERNIFNKIMLPPQKMHWTYSQDKINKMIEEGRIRINNNVIYTNLYGDKIRGIPEYLQSEETPIDSNWMDLKGYTSLTGYPTENSEELLERIILSVSKENGLVMDIFGGSGTTAAVAEKLERRWVVCDFGKHSIYTMQKRIMNIAESKELGTDKKKKYRKPPKPFCVVSTGAYDFSKIMDLRKNKESYISFVLGLFNIPKENKQFSKKYKINNIFGEKDNNPVEVYPIWEDEYLINIKIDEDYLRDIIKASGSKIKGDYYIITPESCTNTNDITIKNDNNEKVNFKFLKFPYKVLEDFSRQFQIEEQASSQSDINKLISSTAFYFNQEVKIKTERTETGIKIKEFKTNILNKNKEKFEGLEGLALILVDFNYDGKIFEMDTAIYAKEIKENIIKIENLTDSSYLIAIDKHGNESKPIKI
ncbi:MAG TPA: site-specific DNA-methyltransferase [Ignavibacteria bacterium]